MIRLDKYLADMGVGTRTEVKRLIRQGKVRVDGAVEKSADKKVDECRSLVKVGEKEISYVQYEYYMLGHDWASLAAEVGIRTDVSRFGAQVINGIGFLGAGTIIVTGRQEVKGLTTAAGLWASACMGLAIGAGFYECVAMAFLMIFLSVHVLTPLELLIIENARNMNIYVEFRSLDNVSEIINRIKSQDVQIYEAEVDHGQESISHHPNAIFALRMHHKGSHAKLLASISEMEDVYVVHDI